VLPGEDLNVGYGCLWVVPGGRFGCKIGVFVGGTGGRFERRI